MVLSMHSPCNALQHTTSEYSQNQRSHARSHNVHARIMPSHVCMTHDSWCGSSQEWDTTFEAHMRVLGDVGGVVWVYENTFHKTLQTFHLGVWKDFSSQKNVNESSQEWVYVIHIDTRPVLLYMGWLRLVSSLKLQVSFAKEPYQKDDILQKRPIISKGLLMIASVYFGRYQTRCTVYFGVYPEDTPYSLVDTKQGTQNTFFYIRYTVYHGHYYRSLLQTIVCFIGLFCKIDLSF